MMGFQPRFDQVLTNDQSIDFDRPTFSPWFKGIGAKEHSLGPRDLNHWKIKSSLSNILPKFQQKKKWAHGVKWVGTHHKRPEIPWIEQEYQNYYNQLSVINTDLSDLTPDGLNHILNTENNHQMFTDHPGLLSVKEQLRRKPDDQLMHEIEQNIIWIYQNRVLVDAYEIERISHLSEDRLNVDERNIQSLLRDRQRATMARKAFTYNASEYAVLANLQDIDMKKIEETTAKSRQHWKVHRMMGTHQNVKKNNKNYFLER